MPIPAVFPSSSYGSISSTRTHGTYGFSNGYSTGSVPVCGWKICPSWSRITSRPDRTLKKGLQEELRDIAQWKTKTQLVLTVNDAIRTSAAVYNHGVLNHLIRLLDEVGIANEHFPSIW